MADWLESLNSQAPIWNGTDWVSPCLLSSDSRGRMNVERAAASNGAHAADVVYKAWKEGSTGKGKKRPKEKGRKGRQQHSEMVIVN